MSSPLPAIEPMTPEEFKRIRTTLGFTQEQLARYIDVTSKTIHNIETAKVGIDTRTALAMRSLERDANGGSAEVATPSDKSR